MNELEKCQMAIKKGITYNPETGKIYGVRGNEMINLNTNGYNRINMMFNCKKISIKST